MSELWLVFLVVLGVNLLPAFGPPTWSLMVLFSLKYDIPHLALIVTGVAAAGLGRWLLAHGARHSRRWLSPSYVDNVEGFGEYITQRAQHAWTLIVMFFVSPLPSAQLFVAAGLMPRVPITSVTLAFCIGRLFTYSIYVGLANSVAQTDVGHVITDHLTSPLGLVSELVMVGLLIALGRIDWRKRLHG
jgi:uncharacterized membrane protein YdjX (TVP38/TMEM64 family)